MGGSFTLVVVLFGIIGDLARKLVLPALYRLAVRGEEVEVALKARDLLAADGIGARVVSLPAGIGSGSDPTASG